MTAHLNPDRNAPFVVFLASDASQGLNARLFYTIPTGISTDAKFRIKEVFVAETDGIVADSWTAEEIAGALRSFTRSSDRQGDWLAALASPPHTPSASRASHPVIVVAASGDTPRRQRATVRGLPPRGRRFSGGTPRRRSG